ncbi:MAG: hypothetical protein ACJA14_001967, partial [Ilumatobacter sp.]
MSVDNMQHDPATANQTPSNAPSSSSKKRSLAKTLSWRVTATTTTFLIAWLVTG